MVSGWVAKTNNGRPHQTSQSSENQRCAYQNGNVRESLRIKGVADGAHAAVHHVGWSYHIRAGAGLAHHLMNRDREKGRKEGGREGKKEERRSHVCAREAEGGWWFRVGC